MAEDDSCTTQFIDGNGVLNIAALEKFTGDVNLPELGLSYAVVAIMGPQSSGKSTLLNHLFHTNFREMDAFRGRSQTTKGIWIAKAVDIVPCTVIMDLEGTDGRERGQEDDTTFEKQSALFALAISDIILINMWCHDIGREQAANRPLLKTVFQVMIQLFSPRKTTLLFVIRDKTRTTFESLELTLREDIQKIWESIPKPPAHNDTPLGEFFNVEVTALSHYEEKEDHFKEQAGLLRQRFFNSIAPGGLAGDRRGVVPASGFSFSAQQIWKDIKENRDLDLPAHRVLLASVRCGEIGIEKHMRLTSDEGWLSLMDSVQVGPVPGFGKRLSSILENYLSEYDTETLYYDENVRKTKRHELESKALVLFHPAYVTLLRHLRSESLKSFKMGLEQALHKGEGFASSVYKYTQACMLEFDSNCAGASVQQANWDASKVREKLHRDIEAHVSHVRDSKIAEIVISYEKQLNEALIAPVKSLFDNIEEDTWASIRKLLKHETDAAVAGFSYAISDLELDHSTLDNLVQNMRNYARSVVEKIAREEARNVNVLERMKGRFLTIFNYDNDSMPRVWTGNEDIAAIKKDARSASLKLLAVMAAIRLDEKPDKVEDILFALLMEETVAISTWPCGEVLPEMTLITPIQCKSLWEKCKVETALAVAEAISVQEAHNNWLPPPWVLNAGYHLLGVALTTMGYGGLASIIRRR